MAGINLLPWREQKREQEKKKFITHLAISAIITLSIIIMVNYYISCLIDDETNHNQRLQAEITIFDNQIVEIKSIKDIRNNLISRMRIVQGLQARRTVTVHMFDELVKILPDGVYLTEVKRSNDRIVLQGYSESNTNISTLMRRIQQNPWIQEPVLTEIKKAEGTKASTTSDSNEFNLSFVLKHNIFTKIP